MKKFRFNLSALLKVRREKEKVAQKELITAQRELNVLKEKMETLQRESLELEAEIRNKQKNSISSAEVASFLDYLHLLRQRIVDQQDVVMKANNIVENKRAALTEVMKERKALEKLKEKKYAEWEKEISEQEEGFLDELATIRYAKDKL